MLPTPYGRAVLHSEMSLEEDQPWQEAQGQSQQCELKMLRQWGCYTCPGNRRDETSSSKTNVQANCSMKRYAHACKERIHLSRS